MKIPLYQVDAFADQTFRGNPAAVCPLEGWLPDETLQNIAFENNLSETAFFVADGDGFELRWFTPTVEVNLCGHATLASSHVLYRHLGYARPEIQFSSKSGRLTVSREGDLLVLDFPARHATRCDPPAKLVEGLGKTPKEVWCTTDYVAVFENEEDVRALTPDVDEFELLELHGVIVTAPGREADFVSRYFAPLAGIDEDPVTGAAHCSLIPFWAGRLSKNKLHARQVSARGGELFCEHAGDRVKIGGRAVTYLTGEIHLSSPDS